MLNFKQHSTSQTLLPSKLRFNFKMNNSCWFKTGGVVDMFFLANSKKDLIKFCLDNKSLKNIIQVGMGSNILVPDEGIRGAIIKLGAGFNYMEKINEVEILCGCSVLDASLATFAMKNSLSGFEFLCGIPGSIGGAIAMNAGCYGQDISKILKLVRAINIRTGQENIFKASDLRYAYRSNRLNSDWIFVEAVFIGNKRSSKSEITATMNAIRDKRTQSQPIHSKTAGSTFKNPAKSNMAAWQLIEEAGCRGLRIGNAGISELHANFIININGEATSSEIKDLIFLVQKKVYDKYHILLEPEIKILQSGS